MECHCESVSHPTTRCVFESRLPPLHLQTNPQDASVPVKERAYKKVAGFLLRTTRKNGSGILASLGVENIPRSTMINQAKGVVRSMSNRKLTFVAPFSQKSWF
jgi:hypothetical protein